MITAHQQLISTLPTEWHEAFLELAAIKEYDGRFPRERAEAEALTEIQAAMLKSRLSENTA